MVMAVILPVVTHNHNTARLSSTPSTLFLLLTQLSGSTTFIHQGFTFKIIPVQRTGSLALF
jgi:hypothetical protein